MILNLTIFFSTLYFYYIEQETSQKWINLDKSKRHPRSRKTYWKDSQATNMRAAMLRCRVIHPMMDQCFWNLSRNTSWPRTTVKVWMSKESIRMWLAKRLWWIWQLRLNLTISHNWPFRNNLKKTAQTSMDYFRMKSMKK